MCQISCAFDRVNYEFSTHLSKIFVLHGQKQLAHEIGQRKLCRVKMA